MPVIGIPLELLRQRVATPLAPQQLVEQLQQLGCDVEGYATLRRFGCRRCDNILEITETEHPPVLCDRCGADFRALPALLAELGTTQVIRMELLAVRPDMFEPGGLARVLRHYLGESEEPARYTLAPPRLRVRVDPSVARPESHRPFIACAVVRGITLDDDLIKIVMKLQENLHWALGRDRKHASIGVYDLATLSGTRFVYRTVGPEELRFVPLGYDLTQPASQLTPRAILAEHPKGRAYAWLLEGRARYPLLCDAAGQVLSLPPIINSEATRVTRATRNFFIDVTGTDERLINRALNILVTSLGELGGAALTLEQVTIDYEGRGVVTPDLTPQRVGLDVAAAARRIGVELDAFTLARLLRRMGHAVAPAGGSALLAGAGELMVEVPAYRNDILHPVDLIEDAAIAYGYHNIVPRLAMTMTAGSEQPLERRAAQARQALQGLGYLEVLTLLLSSEAQQYEALRLPVDAERVVIANPISHEQTIVRTSLLPGLLETFAANTDHPLPQRIFEVGKVSRCDAGRETGARELRRVAAACCGPKADYAELRSSCEALLRELGWQLVTEPDEAPCFIAGRGARAIARRGDQRQVVGLIGELHPEVLERWKLTQPAAVFELELELEGLV
ncbi:MAG: phenylalanine--tRNA ligase subunit beta [Proteobacteria bacterium]|nr:phenylalanine--tRNA ligase subunit beta [Pseudomonadota bacterium]